MKRSGGTRAVTQLAIVTVGLMLIALTWFGTLSALLTEERAAIAHEEAGLSNKVLMFEIQVRRRLLAVDQTLRILEDDWERDPLAFDLPYWQRQARVLSDLAFHIYLTDPQGVVQISSRPELVGVDYSLQPGFQDRARLHQDNDELFIGASNSDPVTQQWQINVARRLDTRQGKFGGVIGLSYTTATGSFFDADELGSQSMIALVHTEHGLIYASTGVDIPAPGGNIANTALSGALQKSAAGNWTGVALPGQPVRMYAFRGVVGRPFKVVLGVDLTQALASHYAWRRGAYIFAAGITVFLLFIIAVLLRELRAIRSREARQSQARVLLEEAYARQATARELAEARSAQLDATLLGMSDGVSVVDAEMRLIQWNSRFSEYTGVPAAMVRVGLPMADALRAQAQLGEFGPVDAETEVARRMAVLWARSQMGVIERARPNGRTMELRRRALPTGGFVTLYADITERKNAELALENAQKITETAMADKSSFVAIVSHEIRTPVNTLLNALTLLSVGELPPRQRDILNVARQSGDALIGLLDDILEMSRADAGQLTLRPASFAIRPLLEGMLEMFRHQATSRGITLLLDCSSEVPDSFYSDAGRLRQVLMNLVSNAVKYSRPGQVVVQAATRLGGGQTVLRLAVRDLGPAIDPADRSRLFQPFSRLEQHSSPLRPGTGLGLVICQRLTALLGGEIGHIEAAGDCNEFWITLPIHTAPVKGAGDHGIGDHGIGDHGTGYHGTARRLPRSRVLLVDDIAANREMIATLLRREGHMVDVAGSGVAAVKAASRTPYDLILMDIFMPDTNGLDATRILRSLGGMTANMPIVALTANAGPEQAASCAAAGMDAMISKPANIGTLLDVIARRVWPGNPVRELADPAEDTSNSLAKALSLPPLLNEARLAELRANLAPDLLTTLIGQCLDDLIQRLPLLKDALAGGRCDRIDAEAHAMAGMASSYGMGLLDQRLQQVMQAARNNDLAVARDLGACLDDDLHRTNAALRAG